MLLTSGNHDMQWFGTVLRLYLDSFLTCVKLVKPIPSILLLDHSSHCFVPQLICNPKYNVWMHMFAWQGSVLQLFQWINSWNPWRVDIVADTVRSLKHLVNPLTYSQEKLLFQSRWCRNLNGNSLSGRVPAALGGRLLHRASFKYVPTAFSLKLFRYRKFSYSRLWKHIVWYFLGSGIVTRSLLQVFTVDICSFTDNAGLCGIPGLPTCGPHLSVGAKVGIALGALLSLLLIVICSACWWKRRQNILRARQLAGKYIHIEAEIRFLAKWIQKHIYTGLACGLCAKFL